MGNSPFISKLTRIFDWLKSTIFPRGDSYDHGQIGHGPIGPGDTSHHGGHGGGGGHGGHGGGGGGGHSH
jgi:hypothetical protein